MRTVGIGTRVLNFLIDTILIFIISLACHHGWGIYVLFYRMPGFNYGWFFFGVLFIYYLFFESIFGRTPGKWVSYSKVVNKLGNKPAFFNILIRSATRLIIIDMFFIPFLDKPLHDFFSNTELIES
jgi:uncharacterized RDD family membrane protein YckC